jgi:hypothetical protein
LETSGARSHLTDPREITALMAQDLNDLRRECGSVTQPQLLDRGWTARQVKDHFLHAMEEAFRTYCETAAPPHEAAQAAPFLEFDRNMRERLADAGASDFDREMRTQLARIEAPLHAISPLGPDEAA